MPFAGFYCPVQRLVVSPTDCLAHALAHRVELPSMGCHQSPEILRGIVSELAKDTPLPPNTWRVTQVISCPRKVRLMATVPYTMTPEQAYWLYRGTIIHALIDRHREPGEAVFAEERLRANLGGIVLTGQPDAVFAGGHLIDYKSTEWLPKNGPSEHHIAQLNAYAWLLAQNAHPVQSAEITYVTLRETRRNVVELAPLAETEKDLRQRVKSLTQKTLPHYAKCWECNYCAVKDACEELAGRARPRRKRKPPTKVDW